MTHMATGLHYKRQFFSFLFSLSPLTQLYLQMTCILQHVHWTQTRTNLVPLSLSLSLSQPASVQVNKSILCASLSFLRFFLPLSLSLTRDVMSVLEVAQYFGYVLLTASGSKDAAGRLQSIQFDRNILERQCACALREALLAQWERERESLHSTILASEWVLCSYEFSCFSSLTSVREGSMWLVSHTPTSLSSLSLSTTLCKLLVISFSLLSQNIHWYT